MADGNTRTSYYWSNWLLLTVAVWLFISPWVLDLPAAGEWAWNNWVVSIIIGAISTIALAKIAEWEDWVTLVVGAWLFFSPWIFDYAAVQSAAWNSFIVGIVVFLISIWGIVAARQAQSDHATTGR